MRPAAASSAARRPAARPSSAACSSSWRNSRSIIALAVSRSNWLVYSITAASPRVFTSARMLATVRSMFSSAAASRASKVVSWDRKSASTVDRRWMAIVMLFLHRPGKGIDDRLQRFALDLERGLVDHQAARDVHDVLDRDQFVGLQRSSGRHQVDDGIRQTGQRRQFHRAVELDQVNMDALGGEMFARRLGVFGGHLQAVALAHGAGVIEAFGDGDHHPALGDLQVEWRVEPFAAMFDQHVLAGYAEVGGTVLDVGRHIGGTDDDDADIRLVGLDDQLAGSFRVFGRHDAGGSEQRQGFVENAALGECDGDAGHGISRGKRMILPQSRKRPGRKAKSPASRAFLIQANLAGLFGRADVGSLLALRAVDDVEGHLLVFGQGLETVALNCREVSEEVFTTFGRGNKTKNLGVVEPLDGTSCHF